jgi:hypothetical protein
MLGGVWPTFLYQTFEDSTLCWWITFSTPYRWWSAMPSTNAKDLNSCRDSYVGITKVEICVAWVVHLHSCLLYCACCLLACWSCYHMLSRGKGTTKVCAIRLQLGDEHMLSGWPLGILRLLFSVKLQVKGYVPSHMCHYCCNEPKGCDWCG